MKSIKKAPIFLIFIFLLSSCVKHVDFDQIEDFSIQPVFKTSLAYFTLNQITFFDRVNSLEIVTPINRTSSFLSLNSSFVRENLSELEIEFEINNHFDRDFVVNFEFLDENNLVTHRLKTFNISANNLNFSHKERIAVSGNETFLSSTKIRAFIQLSPSLNGATIDPNIERKLVFKTAGTFFLKI